MSVATLLGRPRDNSRNTVIENAAIELLKEVGYERVSIESISQRAGVSKATIYRRWCSKAELITDAVHHYAFCKTAAIDTGSLRGDLIEVISEKVKMMKSADGQLLAGLMAASNSDCDLSDVLTSRMAQGASSAYSAIFSRAVERGEITKNAKPEKIFELIPAVVGFRVFMTQQSISRKFIENFVDDVLFPVLKHNN
ncbi:MAG: TetR/AcrR family transcriptional regulator [Actinomycetota bacterium]